MSAVQVQRHLQECLGSLVNVVYEDNHGQDVTIDAERGWQSLVKLLQVKRWTVHSLPPYSKHLLFMTGRLDE
jgi:hypothetical protein